MPDEDQFNKGHKRGNLVWLRGRAHLQRCLRQNDTAAERLVFFELAVDASDATLVGCELRAVPSELAHL